MEETPSIGDEELLENIMQHSLKVAQAAAEGLDDDGLWYEKEGSQLINEKHWWPQAEALVGFFNTL